MNGYFVSRKSGDSILENILGSMKDKNSFPEMDAIEKEDLFSIKFNIPGMKKEEININIEKNMLTVSGNKKNEMENESLIDIPIQERFYGEFSRSILIPESTIIEGIKAKYNDGVLEIIIPKAKKESLTSSIKID
jgi:HSP20 family protein